MSIDWAHHRDGPVTYGDDTTYELGAAWLRGLHVADRSRRLTAPSPRRSHTSQT